MLTGHQISWCDIQSKERGMDSIIKFDGVPYMIVGTNILHCQFGTNKSAADRERRKAKRVCCFTLFTIPILSSPFLCTCMVQVSQMSNLGVQKGTKSYI